MENWRKGEVARVILEVVQTQEFANWFCSSKLNEYRINPDASLKEELLGQIKELFRLERKTSP